MEIRRRRRGRDRVAIVAEILDMTRDGELKSNIMWRARLSYFMLNGYLGLMVEAGLLEKVLLSRRVKFKATQRGMKFLYHCREIMELLGADDVGERPFRRLQLLPFTLSS